LQRNNNIVSHQQITQVSKVAMSYNQNTSPNVTLKSPHTE